MVHKVQTALKGMLSGFKATDTKLLTAFGQMNTRFKGDIQARKDHIAQSIRFNIMIAFLIIFNALLIGIEVDHTRGNSIEDRLIFFILDLFFAIVFFVEMLVRQNQLGWDYFIDPWNIFDYTLVVLNCADIVVSVTKSSGGMRLASTFRVLRLLRVVRTIKGLKMFYSLWMVIQGMLDSLRTVGWISLLLLIMVYCMAVTLTTLKGYNESVIERWRFTDEYVGTVFRSMLTIIQVITLDAWCTDIARPLGTISPISMVLLILAIILCTFGVLNIIIAVMVERMQTMSKQNQDVTGKVLEKTEEMLLSSMADDFCEADLDGNGELEIDEFRRMIAQESMSYKLRLLGVMAEEAESLFDIMDADHSGSVSPEEFVTGLQKLKGFAKGQDLVQLICFAQKQSLRANQFLERLTEMNRKADIIQARLNGIGRGVTHEIRYQRHAAMRNDDVWKTAADRQQKISQLDKTRQVQFPSLPITEF